MSAERHKMEKFMGIKKAAGTMKRARHALAYMDIKTGYVWANEYSNANSWTRYDNKDITGLKTWIGFAFNELGEEASWTEVLTWAAEAAIANR